MENQILCGLSNLGNTCFLNTVVQCLTYTPKLSQILKANLSNKDNVDTLITREWIELQNILHSNASIVTPTRFVKIVHFVAKSKKMLMFSGYTQNDTSEFLFFLFDSFHASISRSVKINVNQKYKSIYQDEKLIDACCEWMQSNYHNDYSELKIEFNGIQVYRMYDTYGKHIQDNIESFFILHLPIPEKPNNTIYDCLDLYTVDEHLKGDDMWYNSNTKTKMEVTRKLFFFSLPSILIIDLKRFNNQLKKNTKMIDIPIDHLDLSKYMIESLDKRTYIYELYAMCNHNGNIFCGHYTAYVKHNQSWYHLNDNKCTYIENIQSCISNKNYCLFYRKK